jgi:hypothetical protein
MLGEVRSGTDPLFLVMKSCFSLDQIMSRYVMLGHVNAGSVRLRQDNTL